MSIKSEVSNMPSRLQISEVSEQADGLPRLLDTPASASCAGLRDKNVTPQQPSIINQESIGC